MLTSRVEDTHTLQFNNSTPLQRFLHKSVMVQIQDVHSNAIHNSQKLEVTQPSINIKTNK